MKSHANMLLIKIFDVFKLKRRRKNTIHFQTQQTFGCAIERQKKHRVRWQYDCKFDKFNGFDLMTFNPKIIYSLSILNASTVHIDATKPV